MPAEHGTWAWFFVPFFVGVGVAGAWSLPIWLLFWGGLALFFLRSPLTIWLKGRSGRGRRDNVIPARNLSLMLVGVAGISAAGLIMLGRWRLLWLGAPIAGLLAAYAGMAWRQNSSVRTLWLEIGGAAGLALMAPAVLAAHHNRLSWQAWALWLLLAAINGLGALYVRLRIHDTHRRPAARAPQLWWHLIVLIAVIAGIFGWGASWMLALPYAGIALRSAWAAIKPRPIPNIKRFGFAEIGVAALCGAGIVLGLR